MDQKEKLKQMKYAMNARMFLIAAGLFLIFTAVTSTVVAMAAGTRESSSISAISAEKIRLRITHSS